MMKQVSQKYRQDLVARYDDTVSKLQAGNFETIDFETIDTDSKGYCPLP